MKTKKSAKRESISVVSELDKIIGEAKSAKGYMLTVSVHTNQNTLMHHLIINNFPVDAMLNCEYEQNKLIQKEHNRLKNE
jgi:hypothetical protein